MTTLTPEDRARLRDLASQATPGPWEAAPTVAWGQAYVELTMQPVTESWDSDPAHACCEPLNADDAAHIAACDPATVTALLDALDAAETALASIMAREEEVGQDEGWQIGGAWGEYGEVVVPLRILSYVVGGELDQKIVSTDPGYAATYAEQVARAEQAEAARDTAERQVQAVRELLEQAARDSGRIERNLFGGHRVHPCEVWRALGEAGR